MESPPPITLYAPNLVAILIDWAIIFVPFSKGLYSKTPKGPFHKILFEFFIILSNC